VDRPKLAQKEAGKPSAKQQHALPKKFKEGHQTIARTNFWSGLPHSAKNRGDSEGLGWRWTTLNGKGRGAMLLGRPAQETEKKKG